MSAADTSVTHSQRRSRTKAKPARRSSPTERDSVAGAGRRLMRLTATAETANVEASTTNAVPTPATAIRRPPRAGPAKRAPMGSISSRSALAWRISSCGTTLGTMAVKAGWKSASPKP